MDASPEPTVVFDVDAGRFVLANAAAGELLGGSVVGRRTLSGPAVARAREDERVDPMRFWIAAAAQGPTPRFEWVHQTADGMSLVCDVRLYRFVEDDRVFVVGRLTPKPAHSVAEPADALFRAVTACAFHDVDHLLLAWRASIDEILDAMEPEAAPFPSAVAAKVAGERVGAILEGLRVAFREPSPLGVDATIERLSPLIRSILGSGRLELDLTAPDSRTSLPTPRFARALLQLAVDAREAEAETLRLGTRHRHGEPPEVWVSHDLAEDHVDASAPPRDVDILSERLMAVQEVVEAAGGTVTARAWSGIGTSVRLVLPRG
ncbi:MAG: hypothetical protein KC619_12905 [Myxococcales bacterium]|nr:hypothetical protein [Myxococcales bacterium]